MTRPTEDPELTPEELEAQDGEELPAREAMSVINPDPLSRPVLIDRDDEIVPPPGFYE